MRPAHTVIENAGILTMDATRPHAEALAIRDGRILAVGSHDDIAGLIGAETRRIDAQGCTVLPGLTEAHLHLFAGGFGLRLLQMDGLRGLPALREALQSYSRDNPDEALLFCKAADYDLFEPQYGHPREMLDAALPDRPVLVMAGDHHTCWANTIALQSARILHGRDLPTGHEVVMAPDGTATGELREHEAYGLVMALRSSGGRETLGMQGREPDPGLTPAQRAEDLGTLRAGLRHCASFGFTNLHNMDGNFYTLELLSELEAAGELICRTSVPFHLTPDKSLDTLVEAEEMRRRFATPRLRSDAVKMFMDGVIDSGTGLLVEDYADRPGWKGEPLHDPDRFAEACIRADAAGLQIYVHAIGDGAVRRVLDGYEAAARANGRRDSRHRIEHLEMLHPDDLPRILNLGVTASMQPPHPPGAMDFPLEPWVSRVGPARWSRAFPVRELRSLGVPQAFASDWPVSDVDPMRGVQAAMTRPIWSDDCPDNRLSLHEALHGYTMGGARAGFDESTLGSLTPGKRADIAIFDADLEALDTSEIGQVRAAMTFSDGELVWQA